METSRDGLFQLISVKIILTFKRSHIRILLGNLIDFSILIIQF